MTAKRRKPTRTFLTFDREWGWIRASARSSARSAAATALTANLRALEGQLPHQLEEALPFDAADQVGHRHVHVVEEQLRRVGGLHADLVAADAKARQTPRLPRLA